MRIESALTSPLYSLLSRDEGRNRLCSLSLFFIVKRAFWAWFTMKNNKQNRVPVLHVCAVCKVTGSVGAKWNFFVGDSQVPQRVHKPCGELLQQSAPKDVRTALIPSRELRDEWRAKRLAQDFWGKAFAEAKPLKSSVAAARAQPAPAPAA